MEIESTTLEKILCGKDPSFKSVATNKMHNFYCHKNCGENEKIFD